MGSAERVRGMFQKILQSNLTSLEQEIETLLHYTLRHDAAEWTENPRDKVHKVLGRLLDRGEEVCRGFMDNLHKNRHLFPRILRILNETRGDMPMFKLVVEDLGLGKFLQDKMTLSDFQSIGCKDLSDASCRSLKDIPTHFLQHLMALDIREAFRSFDFNHEAAQSRPEEDTSGAIVGSVHPLDVLCAVLHCSDNFLRQEILKRMSMCHIPLPLLLPAGEDTYGTFLLWAMRGITKSRSQSLDGPKGLTEDSIANISLPVFSFVSLGDCRCTSIAKITDQILSTTQQRNQNNHMQRVMSWGNIQRHIANGLVEICWYFPDDQQDLKPHEKSFAVANLHGDLQSNERQFHLLTQVSCAVFILVENMTEQPCDLVVHAQGNNTNCYFIVQDQESGDHCSQNVLMESDEKLYEKLQSILQDTIQKSPKQVTLSEMSVAASKLGFCCDENQPGCEYGRLHSLDLINDFVNIHKQHDEGFVKQQQRLKVQIAQIEKELCRLTDQGELHTEDYKSRLLNDVCGLLVAQYHHDGSDVGNNLQYVFSFLNIVEQQYFLKWMELHKLSTNVMSAGNIEDVICKIGQMYETEILTLRIEENPRFCAKFPKAALDLLLQGIPLQLIDGDTTSVYFQWVTDVLTELDTRTRGRCRIKVISILGVQGTGKTTLLNTMFGLQFPMDHRQGTRGASMSLIKVEERDLGCDFFVLIDCEGLQASVEERYNHDNELATLVVGLSDIVIVNMALGRTSKMRNILQIVFHALLRMKGSGQKPNCLLVYQKMEGESSKEEPMIEDEEMLRPGEQSDKSREFPGYGDTIECRILKDYWVIPPLDLETSRYSEKVVELKRHILHTIKHDSIRHVQNFVADIKALWNSVKHENHIFRFKNILEEKVYTELYERFLELEWNLCRKLHKWWTDREDRISSQPSWELKKNILIPDVLRKLNEEVKAMEGTLKSYFTDNTEDTKCPIAKTFEAEFMEKVESLEGHLETHYTRKCLQVMILRRGLANTIVEDFIQEEQDMDGINFDIGLYWNEAVAKYQSTVLKHHNIEDDFLQLLRRDMRTRGSLVTEWIYNIGTLSDYADTSFTHDAQYDNAPWLSDKCNHVENCVSCHNKRKSVARFLLEKSEKYVQKMVNSGTSYDPVYGMEILNMVNEVIRGDPMPYTAMFELFLKLQILARFAPLFQKKHDDFFQKCTAPFAIDLDHHGTQVTEYLRHAQQDKRITQKYCEDWLKPAVELKVKKMFKERFVGDYTNYLCAVMKSRRGSSEGSQGMKCIHHAPVEDSLEDICNRYTDQDEIQSLLTAMITSVIREVRNVLHHPGVLRCGDVGALMAAVWSVLAGMSGVAGGISIAPFTVTALNVPQCSSYIDFFVQKLEEQIIKEFRSKNIEEHYRECPFLIC